MQSYAHEPGKFSNPILSETKPQMDKFRPFVLELSLFT